MLLLFPPLLVEMISVDGISVEGGSAVVVGVVVTVPLDGNDDDDVDADSPSSIPSIFDSFLAAVFI